MALVSVAFWSLSLLTICIGPEARQMSAFSTPKLDEQFVLPAENHIGKCFDRRVRMSGKVAERKGEIGTDILYMTA